MLRSALTRQQCSKVIRENVDFISFSFGNERYTGWSKFGFFCIAYHDGKSLRRNYPISTRICGHISEKNGSTSVSYSCFYGLTDLISVIRLFLLTLVILLFDRDKYGMPFEICILSSIVCTFLVAAFTYIVTKFSRAGNENGQTLENYVASLLNLTHEDK